VISRLRLLVAVIAIGAICAVHADNSHIKQAVKQAEAPAEEETLPPLFPLGSKIYGILAAAVGLIVAAGGGIGGGGVLVPVFIMVCGFPAKLAIPLSNVTIFGGSISNCYLNLQKRHPNAEANRPLIDFDLVNVMEPLTIAGAIVGSLMNKLLPGWLITLMLVVVLGMTGLKTFKSGFKRWEKETAEMSGSAVPLTTVGEQKTNYGSTKGEAGNDEDFKAILEEESKIPMDKILLLVICFIGTISFGILRGDTEGHGPLGLSCGSFWYMVLLMAPLPWVLVISMYQRKLLIDTHERKVKCDYYAKHNIDGDIHWDERATVVYPLICSFAGMCAGMFGIGGGIVKGPLMLEMGVDPQVSSGTAAFMIFFTAGAASVSFALFGLLQKDYAIFFFTFGLIFTYVGQIVAENVIKRLGRSSIVIFLIAAIITASTILMGIEGVHNVHETWKHHTTAHLGLCGGGGGGE
jgi:uncharacterized membrane protein YfcA